MVMAMRSFGAWPRCPHWWISSEVRLSFHQRVAENAVCRRGSNNFDRLCRGVSSGAPDTALRPRDQGAVVHTATLNVTKSRGRHRCS